MMQAIYEDNQWWIYNLGKMDVPYEWFYQVW